MSYFNNRRNIFSRTIKILFLCSALLCHSPVIKAKQLRAYLSYATFQAPGVGPYIETYLSIEASTIKLSALPNRHYQGKIEITLSFSQHDSIKYLEKHNLLSPEIKDTNKVDFQFLDQQRAALKKGRYVLKISIADKNSNTLPFTAIDTVFIGYKNEDTQFSDIELLYKYESTTQTGPLTKSGFNLTPFMGYYFPKKIRNLRFYTELYNSNTLLGHEPFLVRYYIIRHGNAQPYGLYVRQLKQDADQVNVVLGDFDITDLPTGNYSLVVVAISRVNKIIATKSTDFQRSNQVNIPDASDVSPDSAMSAIKIEGSFVENITNKDTLLDYINCLKPISGPFEKQYAVNQLKVGDIKLMQQYFYAFWLRRNRHNPQQAWLEYKAEVNLVNAAYGIRIEKGYDSDRGRVYLQYGKPDVIDQEYNSNTLYPYEIWQYYKLKNQGNRKFIFYAKEMSTNQFVLIHSDANGETQNPQWQFQIVNGSSPGRDFDVQDAGDDRLNNVYQTPH